MLRRSAVLLLLIAGCTPETAPPPEDDASRIIAAATADDAAWKKLAELCDDVGPRLSGSAGLERGIVWALKTFQDEGHENVRAERVMVPKWVRGKESCAMVFPRDHVMSMLGLGGSIGTPAEGITAEVVTVADKAELDRIGDVAKGKIVLFNYAMPPYDPVKGARYGETVTYRSNGAAWASEKGAVAALVRSVTAKSLRTPHTGVMRYDPKFAKIPTAAITIEDAELLARLCARGKRPQVKLMMEAKDEGEAPSANVVAELVGREKPDEIVIVSGHFDSWDTGQGAHDDGGGCIMAMETLRILRQLGLRPRRTIRAVLWTNEENGMMGVKTYLKDHASELEKHVAAIESDIGAFEPVQFGVDHKDPEVLKRAAAQLAKMVRPLKLKVKSGSSSSDIGNFKPLGVPALGLDVEGSRYFDLHHTPADTVEKVDRKELARCVAAMAVVAYGIAEMEERIGK